MEGMREGTAIQVRPCTDSVIHWKSSHMPSFKEKYASRHWEIENASQLELFNKKRRMQANINKK